MINGTNLTDNSLLVSLLFNVSLLLLAATILTEIKPMRRLLKLQDRTLGNQLLLAVLFGMISITNTYAGIEIQGAVVNTRVISTTVAGLLGGPLPGLGAGLISGIHRYLYNPSGYTSLACGIGTFLFGVIGSLCHRTYLRLPIRSKYPFLAAITVFGELIQCMVLFLVARPFEAVLSLERTILLPKIAVNSLGMVLFVGVLDRLNRNLTIELAEQQSIALYVAQRCLPFLREGLNNREGLQLAADTIRETFSDFGVVFTDRAMVLASSGGVFPDGVLPVPAYRALNEGTVTVRDYPGENPETPLLEKAAIAVPLTHDSYPIGVLMFIVPMGRNLILDADVRTTESLAQLFSTMLELGEFQKQSVLRQQAEFRALQSQINPHFFYNALNTISALCRTDPSRARETILVLANYFRQSLTINEPFVTLEQELSNVDNYLTLTKARFEEAIHEVIEVPEDLTALRLPPLILQPIVENAIRHGNTTVDDRYILLKIHQDETRVHIQVSDRGHGFPPEILKAINDPECPYYSGLFNVRKRLRSVYGTQCRFRIISSPTGSTVAFSIPLVPPNVKEKRRGTSCGLPSSTTKSTPAAS